MPEENRSQFSRKLASDPDLKDRCSAAVETMRNAANDEVTAVEQSERLTSDDFAVYINARADSALPESD